MHCSWPSSVAAATPNLNFFLPRVCEGEGVAEARTSMKLVNDWTWKHEQVFRRKKNGGFVWLLPVQGSSTMHSFKKWCMCFEWNVKRNRKGKEEMEKGSEALAETEKKRKTPQLGIEPATLGKLRNCQSFTFHFHFSYPSSSFPFPLDLLLIRHSFAFTPLTNWQLLCVSGGGGGGG